MPAQYDLPPWISDLTVETAVKLLLLGFFGGTAPAGATPIPTTGGGGGGTSDVNVIQVGGAAVALGQALAAASLPVVLTAAQIATLAAAAQLPATLGTKTPALSLAVTPSTWVRHSVSLGASGTQAIPAGAIYQYSILTGTGGDGTMTGLPAGYSDSSAVPIVTGFTVSTDGASSAAVVWFTPA